MYLAICRWLLTVVIVCITTQLIQAQDIALQITVKGTVIDSLSALPVEMATVSVVSNGIVVRSAVTDQFGKFQTGVTGIDHYTISVSLVGYQKYISQGLGGKQDMLIYLQSTSASLKEVTVAGRKALVQSKGDKLIYNAAADVSNKAGTATDVLRKVPLLNVGADGELKMRGSSNIKVLLNGMPSGIMAKNLKEALKMIPAATIQSIEVITSPSAKYEAEGAAGVVNIITKKAVRGTSGNIDISGGNLEQSVNGSLNASRKRFDFNLNVNTNRSKQRNVSTLNRTSVSDQRAIGELFQQNDATQYDRGSYAGFGIAYRPDSTQKLGADLSYWAGSWPAESVLYNQYYDGGNVSQYNQQSKQTGNFQYYELALNYQKKFRKKGQELQIRGLAARSTDRSDYTTNQFGLTGFNYFTEKGPNRGKTWEADLQTDYVYPLNRNGKNLLETGVRFTHSSSNTSYQVFNNQANPGSGSLKEIASRSDEMDYFSNIYAAYASLKIEFKNNWTFRPGIRFEGTQLGSAFKSNQPSFNATFNNWAPSILISKKLNDNHELKFNYTERIRRPFIWDLNPYVNASDPRNLTSGNPQLRPETTRMLEIGHNMNTESGFTMNSSLYYNSNTNAIESFTMVDAKGISRTTPSNVATTNRLGANFNAFLQINPSWMANGGVELYQVWFKSKALAVSNSGAFYSVSLNTSYNFNAYTLQVSGDYSNGYITLQGKNSAYCTYHISVQRALLKKKASILLSVSNPFQHTLAQRNYIIAPTFTSTAFNNFYNGAFSLTFSWKFGIIKVNSNDDDKKYNEGLESGGRKRRL
jgi:ferric enterobactin receptor